ncbi:MAG: hypothetical protein WAV43_06030 [Streptococcus parauberis]
MIQELNLTPSQLVTLMVFLLLLFVLLTNIHNSIEIDLPDIKPEPKQTGNPLYGAYMQSQSKYYN